MRTVVGMKTVQGGGVGFFKHNKDRSSMEKLLLLPM
jgi:hypothetical protein